MLRMLGTFSAFHHIIIYTILSGYNSRIIQDIKFKFSAFLSVVEVTKCVTFQSARCKDFQVDIFRVSPIVLKELREEIATVICLLFERSFQTSQLPVEWTKVQVCPFLKKGVATKSQI